MWAYPYRTFKFFASLPLAIFILSALMVILAAGTLLESRYGTDTARLLVYESRWFSLVLFILALNVAAAAFDRFPWKKKHAGFVITHLGIIIILIGSFLTQRLMIDGQMAIAEGETVHRLTLPEPLLYIASEAEGRDWITPLKKKPFAWQGRTPIPSSDPKHPFPFKLSLLNFYPKAKMEEKIVSASEGPAAVKVTLHNSFVNQTHWLLENDPALGEISVGPAKLKFTDVLLKEFSGTVPRAGYLEFQFEKTNVQIPIPQNPTLPLESNLEGMPYKVQITRLLKNAVVEGKNLIENEPPEVGTIPAIGSPAGQWRHELPLPSNRNPALQLILQGNGLEERHTVFANFPEFPTLHGMRPSEAGARIFYRLPNAGSKGKTNELRFVRNVGAIPNSSLQYQIQDGMEIRSGTVELGKDTPTGWMDLKFRVDEYFLHAKQERHFSKQPNTSMSEEAVPAIRIEIAGEKAIWLRQGVRESIQMGDQKYHFLYGERRIPAGFRLTLRDFRIEHYPGTNRPASFESDVTLKDDARGIVKDTTISMNQPLVHRGFKIYQSGYSLTEGQPEISIFAVGRDPGVPWKYAGTLVMVAGILTMYYSRAYSTHGGKLNDS